jgi:endonuclease G
MITHHALLFIAALLVCLAPYLAFSQSLDEKVARLDKETKRNETDLEALKLEQIQQNLNKNALPKLNAGEKIIRHPGFALVYAKAHEQPKWVAHIILPDILNDCEERTELFLQDTSFAEKSVDNSPYANQKPKVYDRGHLAPAADLRWSPKATFASFLFSNICPQKTTLNQKFWGDLEDWLRAYVRYYESPIYVLTGPVLKSGLKKLSNKEGTASVSIPEAFFKIAVDLQRQRAIAFLVPQDAKSTDKKEKYLKTIDEIETATGIDFFAGLNKTLENDLESQLNLELWDVNGEVAEAKPLVLSAAQNSQGLFNSLQAKDQLNKPIKVCGKVITVNQSDEDFTIRLTLDQAYEKGISSITVKSSEWGKVALLPYREFRGRVIVAAGTVKRGFQKRVNIEVRAVEDIQLFNNE